MYRFKGWSLVAPAIFATIVVPIALSAQSPEKSLVNSGSVITPALTSQTKQPSAEQTGDSLAVNQHYQAAIEAYSKAPEMTAVIWNKMGISYQLMFNSKEAMRCYRESLKIDPLNPQVLNNLGTVFASMKEYGQADRMYRKALKISPASALILKNLGTDELSEGKYEKGWQTYQQAIAIDPKIFADHTAPKVENPSSVHDRGAMNYYMALGCARSGYVGSALEYLRAAIDEGFVSRKKVATDAEFARLRSNPAFQQLVAEPTAQ